MKNAKYVIIFLLLLVGVLLWFISNHNINKENGKTINLYTSLPYVQIEPFILEYEAQNAVTVNVININKFDWQEKIPLTGNNGECVSADVLLTDVELMQTIAVGNTILQPLDHVDNIEAAPEQLKDAKNRWLGIWYDPIVIVANADIDNKIKQGNLVWEELLLHNNWRIAMNDCLATDTYGNMLYYFGKALGEENTIKYFQSLHKNVVKYSQFLDAPIRMTGIGECDVAVTIQSEALKYMYDGFPLYILYPDDGTVFLLTAAAVLNESKSDDKKSSGAAFVNWLFNEDMDKYVVKNKFHFVPVNSGSLLARNYYKYGLRLLKQDYLIDEKYKAALLHRWAKEVRFINNR